MNLITEFNTRYADSAGSDSECAEFCFWLDENAHRIKAALMVADSIVSMCCYPEGDDESLWNEIEQWEAATK